MKQSNFLISSLVFVISVLSISTLAFVLTSCSQYSEPQGAGGPGAQKVAGNGGNEIVEPLEATFSSIKLNIINKKCIGCHKAGGIDKKASEIPLTKESEVLKGATDLGDLVVPGDPNNSLFYRVMVKDEKIRGKAKAMPPAGSQPNAVTPDELTIVAAWIAGVAAKNQIVDPADPGASQKKPQGCTVDPKPAPVLAEPAVIDYAFIKTEILDKKCVVCHKADGKAKELVFGDRQELLSLSNSFEQPMVVPGKAIQSLVYLALLKDKSIRQDTRLMPPKKEVDAGGVKDITDSETELIKKWIDQGAK